MADFVLATASQRKEWVDRATLEYVRTSRFMPYMGRTANSVVMTYSDLERRAGDTINVPLFYKLDGDMVYDDTPLVGNETPLDNFNCGVPVRLRGKSVAITKNQTFRTEIDVMNAARESLTRKFGEELRDDIIRALFSVIPSGDTTLNWDAATAANRNSWMVANFDRLVLGTVGNTTGTVLATQLANIATGTTCTAARMGVAKRRAMSAKPAISPVRVNDDAGREYFVAFHGSRTFRDLNADTPVTAANREARPRDVEANPLFQDGDIIYQGIRPQAGVEKSDIPALNRRMTVGMDEIIGVKKAAFNGKQHGVMTAFFSAPVDA